MLNFDDLVKTAKAFADANMRANFAADALHLAESAVAYRLNKLHEKTGLNPYNFYELHEILEKYGECVEND